MTRLLSIAILASLWLLGCQPAEDTSWTAFKKCGASTCVSEALAVKAAFLKNPKGLMQDFLRTYEAGEDHLVGWLYLLRDSVLTNPQAGTYEERVGWRDEVLNAAQPYVDDPKLGEIARVIMENLEAIAFADEVEEEPLVVENLVFTGTYTLDGGDGSTGELAVSEQDGNTLRFRLQAVGAAPARNQGQLTGVATLVSVTEARFSTQEFGSECMLLLRWSSNGVEVVTEKGDPAACGLGAGVIPDGVYARKDYKDPFLSAADAKKAALLQGEWISADDPKAAIRIAEGRLFQLYDGAEVEPPVRCLYFPKCPSGCLPVATTPCLKVIGQDEVCYTIVKADGKTLALSLIGGTGNTNRYVRKK
ncbi:MAG: hypothetical protein RMJ33_10565 [Saprospiraceae bacterium]|nr:hypothetical protein [Saprospiraceae bacterium]MDW8230269.1 hypothetical protein [Saprospiraceae bacterium]